MSLEKIPARKKGVEGKRKDLYQGSWGCDIIDLSGPTLVLWGV
jgi:hypothetical protein